MSADRATDLKHAINHEQGLLTNKETGDER
jgi:hypothetical protein